MIDKAITRMTKIIISLTPADIAAYNDGLYTIDLRLSDDRTNKPIDRPGDLESFVPLMTGSARHLLTVLLMKRLHGEQAKALSAALKPHGMRLQQATHSITWSDI